MKNMTDPMTIMVAEAGKRGTEGDINIYYL
jgi:hypothetical protein